MKSNEGLVLSAIAIANSQRSKRLFLFFSHSRADKPLQDQTDKPYFSRHDGSRIIAHNNINNSKAN